ncbi:GDSL-type esterase/lipase family protein [Streptomyces spiramenti]|uniref:SGNH/GDSL hydrolase family protein n=1 Tax=Streptomyces spiramenti TaxID=2720606 RepID=A0ABX1AN68_9ACTN|nr:GDSL-type esterase/lipase family protein [Streptomyces spiramenti]NJP66525.1 SGNH/GDSL hydrolase family protein [Streptomyces spiramenti]
MPVSRPTHPIRPALAAVLAAATLAACSSSPEPSATRGEAEEDSRPEESAGPRWNPEPTTVAAIGDSITTGFDTCELLADCPEVSWATGTEPDVDSLASRLGAAETWNEAVAGAMMADLPDQARLAAANDPELVTVLAGANDACTRTPERMTETDEFRAAFTRTVEVIREEAPQAQIFVASVPDLMQLWRTGREEDRARMAWQFGICQSMLRDAATDDEETQERRATVAERVDDYNEALAEVCAEDVLCRFDGGAVADYTFRLEDLSEWDWFHPSREGQAALAELAYTAVSRED